MPDKADTRTVGELETQVIERTNNRMFSRILTDTTTGRQVQYRLLQ